ncbi:hypothetical protein ACP70R_003415 [Stipagrostis hirtigluma subsp. patula]
MPPSVKIVDEARVAVPATAALPRDPLRLSALDALWVALPLIQRVLIFEGAGGQLPPFASVVAALRASLAETVARFPPLAGRIVHLPSTGDAAIDCTERGVAGGVRFLVAESDDDSAEAAQLAGDPDHDVEAFRLLVPTLDAGELPAETMAAQVTRLPGGGVALGVAMHHAVVDGRSVWRFLQAWAAACRGEGEADAAAAPPTFDRAAVRLPGGEELARSVLRKYAPDLPKATMAGFLVHPNLSRRTFTVSAQQMRRLKQRIADHTALPPPSSFVAVVALSWVSFVWARHRAGAVSPDDEVTVFFFADGRARLDPPPGDGYFGTCIAGCLARATARDLLAGEGAGALALARAAAAVAGEVRRAAEEPLALWDWMEVVERVDLARMANVSASTRFPAYEASDFGWGPPSRTELVTMNHDGQIVLLAGKGGAGAVQASVSIHPAQMDAFKAHFLSYLG